MRAPSPIALALAGTVAAHLIVITSVDVLVVTRHVVAEPEVVPHVELTDVEVAPIAPLPAPPPPPEVPAPPQVAQPAPVPTHHAAPAAAHVQQAPTQTRDPDKREPATPTAPSAGGTPVYHMDNLAPGAVGSPAGIGHDPIGNRSGHGGAGGGSGSGAGAGSAAGVAPAAPMSIATIKTRALPKPGFDVLDVGRDYPAEAKQLGIEGSMHVRLIVDAQGKVTSARLLDHLGHGLDELALRRAAAIEFTPALDADDHPVASVVIWTFAMHLPAS